MKVKKLLAKILSLSIVISSSVFLASCGTQAENSSTVSAPELPLGIYTNIQDFEDVKSRLSATQAMNAESDTVGEISSLTVYSSETAIKLDENNNAIKGDDGEIIHVDNDDENNVFYKYIFVKDAVIAGESFLVYNRGQYTGYCKYDAETGTLAMYTPEYFMTYTTNRKELDNWSETVQNTKVTDEILANPKSGLSFASEWQSHSNNTLAEPMEVKLSDDLHFSFVSQYLADDSGVGNNYNYQFEDYSNLYNNKESIGGNSNED